VELIAELGRGAATAVYRGRRGDRQYAIKLLHTAGGEQASAAFRREAALLARLTHPGLVRIHEVGDAADRPYLIMDLVVGQSLAQALAAAKPLDEARVVAIAVDVTSALTAAHRTGLVHRDIKPDNIMIDDDGSAKVIDFGLASHAGHTNPDVAVGTFVYAAPEQTGILHRPVDGRSDLYALGVVLFECLTGAPPFVAEDVGELIRMHLSAIPPNVRESRPDVSPEFASIIAKLLAKDPDDRYASGDGVLADLAHLAAGRGGQPASGIGDPHPDDDESGLVGPLGPRKDLLQLWRGVLAGRGGLALIQGAPGSGKSRLAREITAAARRDGHIVLYGKSDLNGAVPLAPLRTAVDRFVREIAQLPAAELAAAVERLRNAAGPTAAALRTLSPALTDLLAIADAPSSEDDRQFDRAVAMLLVGLAESVGGAVLHLDNLQWWDEGTRRVVRQLVPILRDAPLLLLVTARDDAQSGPAVAEFLAEHEAAVDARLAVRPLDEAAVASLVVRLLGGGRVPADLIASLVARSGGNPMAVEEYIRAVIEAGLIRPYWGAWLLDSAGLADLALPEDVTDLVVRRVEGLGDLPHQLLTAAAAVGARFDPDLVAEVCSVTPQRALAAFADGAEHGLIELAPAGGYAFLHERIREALLTLLDTPARRALHQRIAEALERAGDAGTERVYEAARHYLAGDLGAAPEGTFRATWAAGKLALAEHAAAEAVEFLIAAVTAARRAGVTPSSEVHAALGVAAARVGRYGLSDEHLGLSLASETRPVHRARLYMEMASSRHMRWEANRALEMIFSGLAELGHPLPRHPVLLAARTTVLFLLGIVVGWLPRRVRLVSGEAREIYTLRADLLNVGAPSAAMANRQPLMAAFAMCALHLVNRLERGSTYVETQACLAICAMVFGWRAQAGRIHARVAAAAASIGDPRIVDRMEYLRGVAYDIAPAIGPASGQILRRVIQRHWRGLDSGEHLTTIGALGGLQILRGYRAEAAELYQQGVDRYGVTSESLGNPFATLGAQAAALGGQSARAAAQLRDVRKFVETLAENRGQLINLAIAEIHLAVEQGEVGDVLDQALARFAELKANPAFLWAFQRALWVYQAFGRLAQLAAAPAARRAERLDEAQRAIRKLRRVANGPVLRAFHTAATASLSQLRGDNRTALRTLARQEAGAGALDLPLLEYEVARIRARALRALDRPEDAGRQAAIALLLADRYGWRTRGRWIRTEFDIDTRDRSSQTLTMTTGSAAGGGTANLHQRRLKAIHQVGLAASTVLDPAQLARVALDEILEIFVADRAFLFLQPSEGDGLEPYLGRAAGGIDLDELTSYGSTLVERVHDSGTALVVTGSEEGEALGSRSTVVHGLRSIMVAPLLINRRRLGVVYLDSRTAKGIFTDEDVDILAAITNHVAASLETARAAQLELAVHAAERARDTADSLRAAMSDLAASLDPIEVGNRLVARVAAALPDTEARLLAGDAAELAGAATPMESSVIRRGTVDPPAGLIPAGARDWLAVPLWIRGTNHGVLVVSTTGRPYTDAEVGVVAALAEQGATALENASLFGKVQELAIRDGLTGLYNRRHFFELSEHRIRLWRRHHAPVAAMMIDIDHFKAINDGHGHAVGDEVIREVARRLVGTLRETDLLCRYGGEEFAVLLPETTVTDAHEAAGRLHKAVTGAPIATAAGLLPVTVSVGLAGPDAAHPDANSLLTRADEALYAAKRAGRDRVFAHDRTGGSAPAR
jgi:diguanylate cyclase (GGDEF)-like protein